MTSKKRKSPGLLRIWTGRAGRAVDAVLPHSPRLILALLALAGVAVIGFKTWQQVEPLLAETPYYALRSEHIDITPQPEWILSDVKAEAIRDTSLDTGISVLDQELASRVADAFAFHPWVKEVRQVVKQAGPRVVVDVDYRRPIAVIDPRQPDQADSIPIDVEGVRLPSDDIPVAWKQRLPRIVGIASQPLVGQTWNDSRVGGAARLAVILADHWQEFGLAEITIRQPQPTSAALSSATDADSAIYELVTTGGRHFVWGHAPDSTWTDEPTDEQKLAHIKRSLRRRKIRPIPQVIDLRRDSDIPRTAREPSKPSSPVK
jgi:hypothetical protein